MLVFLALVRSVEALSAEAMVAVVCAVVSEVAYVVVTVAGSRRLVQLVISRTKTCMQTTLALTNLLLTEA
jgi:hypothetical protein